MNSPAINTPRRSKHPVLSVALVMATVLSAARTANAQQLQQGISVEMAVTSNAAPVPEADREDALILTVTDNGSLYFGINSISPAALTEELKRSLSNRGKNLYIKADARTAFSSVAKVLDAARDAGIEAPTLLTSQSESPQPGTVVSPKGLAVRLAPLPTRSESIVVQVLSSGQRLPLLKINHERVPWDSLHTTLSQLIQGRTQKVVMEKADGLVPFVYIVRVIDNCRSAGAPVLLVTAGP